MSNNLFFTNNLSQGWSTPNSNYATPTITSLSGTYSPAGGNTLVAIFGTNFRLYSAIKFGTYSPTIIFINSGQIDFYVPSTASYGDYPVQVFNDVYGSNIVVYKIDDAPGFWTINSSYSNVISNSNLGGLSIEGSIVLNNNVDTNNNVTKQFIEWVESNTVIASITANSTGLDINAEVNATNFNQPSDYRIKDIIEPLNASYNVDNLNPVKYFNKKSKKMEIGFIANEVQEIFPYLVTGEKDGKDLQMLNYMGLIGVLVQEIKELKTELKELKEVNNLK
jgi:hypothetical protein